MSDFKIEEIHAIGAVRDMLGQAETVFVTPKGEGDARKFEISLEPGMKRVSTVVVGAPAILINLGGKSFWVMALENTSGENS